MEGKAVWAVSELQTDGAGREMDSLSISLDLESRRKEKTRAEGAGCEMGESWQHPGCGAGLGTALQAAIWSLGKTDNSGKSTGFRWSCERDRAGQFERGGAELVFAGRQPGAGAEPGSAGQGR